MQAGIDEFEGEIKDARENQAKPKKERTRLRKELERKKAALEQEKEELESEFPELLKRQYMRAVADPGEAVGCLAAQVRTPVNNFE